MRKSMTLRLFFAADRCCMLPKQLGVSLMQKYSCCSQGLVFLQQQVVINLLPLYRDITNSHATKEYLS
ncbi:hypothetical protein F4810DRAFT_661542 [Camillea tinctor]|nr:hypothetical protein F4810DRAFT_661542 [Camillea tinctor]